MMIQFLSRDHIAIRAKKINDFRTLAVVRTQGLSIPVRQYIDGKRLDVPRDEEITRYWQNYHKKFSRFRILMVVIWIIIVLLLL